MNNYQNPYYPYYNQYSQIRQPQIDYKPSMLQGKQVDSIEVVKGIDIPLDRKYKLFSACKWKCNSN